MAKDQEFIDRMNSEEEGLKATTSDDLICKDCKHRNANKYQAATCAEFPIRKPAEVLYGGSCPLYEKED